MSTETQKVGVLADLQRLLDLSESTMDADTSTDATFIPVPIEEFVATVRSTSAAIADLVKVAARAIPFLRDEAEKYEDDGSNEPLETARHIEELLARIGGAA